jgi:hypothetical protein
MAASGTLTTADAACATVGNAIGPVIVAGNASVPTWDSTHWFLFSCTGSVVGVGDSFTISVCNYNNQSPCGSTWVPGVAPATITLTSAPAVDCMQQFCKETAWGWFQFGFVFVMASWLLGFAVAEVVGMVDKANR